jgi:hypothetical protein
MKASVLFGTIWEDDSLEVLWRDTPAEPSASSDGNAPDRVKLPKLKVEQRVLSVLDHTQMRALIGFKPKTFRQARTHLAVLLILDTGLRLSTIGYIGRNRFAVAGRSTILPIAAQVKYPTR